MRKVSLIIWILIMMFGQLAAQTFDKKISIPLPQNSIRDVLIDKNAHTIFLVRHSMGRSDSLSFESRTIVFRIDSAGQLIDSIVYKASDFSPQLLDTVNHVGMDVLVSDDGQLSMFGTVRSGLPLSFSFLKSSLDTALRVVSSETRLSIQDTFPATYSFKEFGDSRFYFGGDLGFTQGIFYGSLTLEKGDSITDHFTLFDDSKGYWLGTIYDLLIDSNQSIYTFSDAYSGPPSYLVEGLQINKIDSSLDLLKKENCSIPTLSGFETPFLFNGDYNALWISDTSFLIATAISNNQNSGKGDVHLMIYDTSLNRVAYKRILSLDTNHISFSNCLTYDSLSQSIYFGVTQGLHEFSYNDPFRNQLPTSFRLFKMDKDLNIIWDRSYYNEATIRLEHVVSDQRGNITMAGTYEDSTTRANNYERHLYILRVDSMGNFNPVGIADRKKIPSRDYLFYPNPMNDRLLARRFNHQKDYQLRFYDSGGKLIEQLLWKEDQLKVNTSNWPKGVILYQLEDQEGRRASGKLIKQ